MNKGSSLGKWEQIAQEILFVPSHWRALDNWWEFHRLYVRAEKSSSSCLQSQRPSSKIHWTNHRYLYGTCFLFVMLRKILTSVANSLHKSMYLLVCRAKEFFQVVVHSKNWINLQRHHSTKLETPFKKPPVKPHVQTFILTSWIKKTSCYSALYGDSNSLLIPGYKNCGCRLSRCIPLLMQCSTTNNDSCFRTA